MKMWNDGPEFDNWLDNPDAPAVARRHICNSKGGGSGGSPPSATTSTVTQNSLPEYARPYFESLMGRSQQVSNDPYQEYRGDRIAPFTPQQTNAFNLVDQNVGSYQPGFTQAATNFNQAGAFTPGQITNTYTPQETTNTYTPQAMTNTYTPQETTNTYTPQAMTNTYTPQTMTPGNWTDAGVASSYMNPYTQNVTNIGKREAVRDFDIQQGGRDAAATRGGAFGGYRDAIVNAEANRNLMTRLGDIQQQGDLSAYNTGLAGFNQDRSAQIGANQLNNQFGQQLAQLGMTAAGESNRFGQQQSQLEMAAADANNRYRQQLAQLGMSATGENNRFGQQQSQLEMAAADANNRYRQQQSQLGMTAAGESNRYGLSRAEMGLRAGQAQAGLGQAQQQAGLTDAQSLISMGAMQQGMRQSAYDTAYQDFINQRDYNRQNLNWVSGQLRGVPVSANTSTTGYQAPPSAISQIAGLGLGAAGLSSLLRKG